MVASNHKWSFSSVGGVKRVNIDSGLDLVALEHLDQKLWTVLSCPIYDLEIDSKTLELIDGDSDGHIKVAEVLAAIKWIISVINNPDDLLKQDSIFPLSAINIESAEGKILMASAKNILKNLGKPDADVLTVEETSDLVKIFTGTEFNGDGIITEDSSSEDELRVLIAEVISCVGSAVDRGGKEGINSDLLQEFLNACTEYSLWRKKSEDNNAVILPFGANTENCYQAFITVKSKIEDYFLRCRLAAFPLAKIEGNKHLPLVNGVNPAWEKELLNFKGLIIDTLYPHKQTLSETEWNHVCEKFIAYALWKAEKAGAKVETLGTDRIRQILSGDISQRLFELIEKDKSLETEANNIILVDKLVRYYRDLFTLIKNFVTFYDFYSPEYSAIFQAGTLYLDQRSCDLCIKVSDMAKHEKMVSYSGMFLIYCKCVSKSTNESIIVVAALTNGDVDDLVVGRNAVFYDRKGMDYDATIIKIVDNPISIRQAFWSPYRKVSRFIETQINKFAAEQDNKVIADVTGKIETAPAKIETPHTAPPPPFDVGKFVGIFAAIGLALGAIGTALAAVLSGFLGLVWWQMPIAIAGIVLLISGPSMIIAFLKLRQRNLALILDANGWAINAKVIINIVFGNTLTQIANLPKGAQVNTNDPFTPKGRPLWQTMFFIALILGGVLYLLWKYEFIKIHF